MAALTIRHLLNELNELNEGNSDAYPEVPPQVEYELTETSLSLNPVLDSMVILGTE